MKKKLLSAILTGSLLVTIPMTGFAKEEKYVDYVALGDSLAAGVTPYHSINKGYVNFLGDRYKQSQYEINLNNYGRAGYQTTDIINELLDPNNDIRSSISEAELITIDIGANDLLAKLPDIQRNPLLAPEVLQQIATNLFAILSEIDKLNPNTKVYVMGYYNPFPHQSKEQQAALLPLLNALNQTLQTVTIANGDVYVPTEKAIKKYETTYVPNPFDIHLSLEGYQVVAKEFWKAIQNNQ